MSVNVEITPEAYEQAQELREPIYSRVMAIVERLKDWPQVSGAKPLHGALAGHYRVRTGAYRVQFRIVDKGLVGEKIGHRDGFYEE